jgi:hypothetical protein
MAGKAFKARLRDLAQWLGRENLMAGRTARGGIHVCICRGPEAARPLKTRGGSAAGGVKAVSCGRLVLMAGDDARLSRQGGAG